MSPHSRGAVSPELCMNICAMKDRGRREDRVRAAPEVSCAISDKKNAHEHTGSAEAIRPSLRSGFNGFLRALPGDRACLPPSSAVRFRQLDASVGASGPHDFAVRNMRRSSYARRCVHRIPPRVRDDREPPLCVGRDGVKCGSDLGVRSIPTGCGISTRRANQQLACDGAVKQKNFSQRGSTALSDLPVRADYFQAPSSLPGIAVRRTASLPLAYAPAIHLLWEMHCAKIDGCPDQVRA